MRRRVWTGAAALLVVLLVSSVPAAAQSFVGPRNGGGWSGTLAGSVLTYNGSPYTVVNGVVTFPDCSTYFVSPHGALFLGAPAALNCTPAGTPPPGSFTGPASGGGWSGTVSGSSLIYRSQSYPIVDGRVSFPDCTTYRVAPNGALFGGAATPNCTPGGGGSGGLITPTITWAAPAAVAQGTALSGSQLNAASGGVAGAFVYTPALGTVMNSAGSQTLSVTFTPTDTATYATATATVALQVTAPASGFLGPASGGGWTGTISGSNLVYGGQSYPIVNGRVNLPDCMTYRVAPNGALFGGVATPNCTPGGGGSGGLTTPTIMWATPASVAQGTALSGSQLNATSGGVAGTFAYTPALGTVMNSAGSQTLSVTFTPTDTSTYAGATASVALEVTPTGGGVFQGPLASGVWSGTISGGNLVYRGQSYPIVGGKVYFPDCTTYSVAPNGGLFGGTPPACKTTPTITWAEPAPISYGTLLSGAQLNASTGVAGTFTYSPAAGAKLNVGTQTLSVTFTPADLAAYSPVTGATSITVTQATPAITWAAPAPITYGTAISAVQLNAAAAGIAGVFVYSPAAGTILTVGSQALSVTFTPSDTTNYTAATATVPLTVNPAAPVIHWTNPAAIAWGTALSATQLNATTPIAGTFVYTPPASTILEPGSQTLSATFTPADTTSYTSATASATIVVNKATPVITWAAPAEIPAGTALSAAHQNATVSVAGTLSYTPPGGTTMIALGNQTLSVAFTPTDTAHYNPATATVTVKVNFVGPDEPGGPASGTLNGSTLTYNGLTYTVVNGKVTFPNCTQWEVSPNGGLFNKVTVANCTPGSIPGSSPDPFASSTKGTIAVTRAVLNSAGSTIWSFDAAYDTGSGRYLTVAYLGGINRVVGQFLGRDGLPIGSTFTIASVGAYNPRVIANGAGLFGVVYTAAVGTGYSLEARIVEANPSTWPGGVSPAVVIQASDEFALTFRPAIAWQSAIQQFLVGWSKYSSGLAATYVTGINPNATPGLASTLVADSNAITCAGVRAHHAMPEFAMAPDGSGMMVGYRDSTNQSCAAYGGLWYRPLGTNGLPIGTVGLVQGATDPYMHREQRVAYSPTLQRYVAVWTRSGDGYYRVFAQKIKADGTRDGDAYIVRNPVLNNADITDDGFGQNGLAYDPAADQFEIASRGADPGNNLAPVWRYRLTSAAAAADMNPVRVESGAVSPAPVVMSDGTGDFGIVYRLDYNRIVVTIVSPNGTVPEPIGGTAPPTGGGGTGGTPPGTTGGGGTPDPNAPNTIGQVGAARLVLSTPGSTIWSFDAAYDAGSGRYLTVAYLGGATRVVGQFLDRDGAPIGSMFTIANVGAYNPRVIANGAGLFGVVYTAAAGAGYSLEARIVEANPSTWPGGVSPAVVIQANQEFALTFRPGIAWQSAIQQFLVGWSKYSSGLAATYVTGINPNATPGLASTLVADSNALTCAGVRAHHAMPEFAMAPDGSGMMVGYRDSTNPSCAAYGGLWYRALGTNGLPIGAVGLVQGATDPYMHREQRVAYSPTLQRYVAVWTRSGDGYYRVFAQKIKADGTRDGDAYIVRNPVLNNADITDDGFGQNGLAYDPAADQFEIASRGADPGNNLAPVWRYRLTSAGVAANMNPVRVESGAVSPAPVVMSDLTGRFLIVYRLDYARIVANLITP